MEKNDRSLFQSSIIEYKTFKKLDDLDCCLNLHTGYQ